MNYWVFKANGYNYDRYLHPDREENWYSRYAPEEAQVGDRVFLWESGGKSRVVGLAEIARKRRLSRDGTPNVRLRYLSCPLAAMPRSAELRQNSSLKNASFLYGGPIRTAYPLKRAQARALHQIVVDANPDVHVWPAVARARRPLRDADEGVNEGKTKLVRHIRIERAPNLSHRKKAAFRERHGRLFCEACGNDHAKYGTLKDAVFEAHHRRALRWSGETETKLKDLAIVCSSCHRAIHRSDPMMSIQKFAALLRKSRGVKNQFRE